MSSNQNGSNLRSICAHMKIIKGYPSFYPHVFMQIGRRLSIEITLESSGVLKDNRARKSRTTLQNKVRLKVLPEQLTLFVNTSVTFKKCIIR